MARVQVCKTASIASRPPTYLGSQASFCNAAAAHEPIFVSFAPDAQEHPLRIDVGNPQKQTFTEA